MKKSLLQGSLPTSVMLGGKSYAVYTDFRHWIQLESLLFEEEGDFLSKLPSLLRLCYPVLPDTIEEAVEGMVFFYEGPGSSTKQSGGKEARPVYSFVQDEVLIYAAFYQQYGIDLTSVALHWWQFKALLHGLSDQTQLAKVICYRTTDVSRLQNPEEKRYYRRMKALYRLCDTRDESERDAEISRTLESLF
ncbi:MAG: hypothetical protein IKW06_02190 [Clostridia bacterium]|nr:hypothetical protein [Clostridia bacterium]